MATTEQKLKDICFLMDPIIEDNTVPRNIRRTIADAKEKILGAGDPTVNIAGAVYALDEVANDINMPSHVRTAVWSIISELERLKEEITVKK